MLSISEWLYNTQNRQVHVLCTRSPIGLADLHFDAYRCAVQNAESVVHCACHFQTDAIYKATCLPSTAQNACVLATMEHITCKLPVSQPNLTFNADTLAMLQSNLSFNGLEPCVANPAVARLRNATVECSARLQRSESHTEVDLNQSAVEATCGPALSPHSIGGGPVVSSALRWVAI